MIDELTTIVSAAENINHEIERMDKAAKKARGDLIYNEMNSDVVQNVVSGAEDLYKVMNRLSDPISEIEFAISDRLLNHKRREL